jgi:hypothetical protein
VGSSPVAPASIQTQPLTRHRPRSGVVERRAIAFYVSMQPRVAIVVTAVLLLLLAPSAAASDVTTTPKVTWANAATAACQSMWERMKSYPAHYWQPLNEDRPLSRIAVLRREWLVIHQDGLTTIRAGARAMTPRARRAVGDYVRMLDTIRRVVQAAKTGDRRAYNVANIHMVLAIVETRKAFARAGAGRVCDFGI